MDTTKHAVVGLMLLLKHDQRGQGPNVSTTPITAIGYRQCLSLSVVQLKVEHCRNPHCRNGVVDTFGLAHIVDISS